MVYTANAPIGDINRDKPTNIKNKVSNFIWFFLVIY